jgi:hypothetical protein
MSLSSTRGSQLLAEGALVVVVVVVAILWQTEKNIGPARGAAVEDQGRTTAVVRGREDARSCWLLACLLLKLWSADKHQQFCSCRKFPGLQAGFSQRWPVRCLCDEVSWWQEIHGDILRLSFSHGRSWDLALALPPRRAAF